jgi:hypothetical protein
MRKPIISIFIEATARILCILLTLAGLGISIAMGILPSNYKIDPGSLGDFGGESAPPPVTAFVCKPVSRQAVSNCDV